VAACTYNFPYTDVASFITLSSILEGVGTSAYLGGAPLITSKYYLTVAGSILAAEALHTSYQRAAIGEVPMANPFETPLGPNPVFTLAAAFIVSCPASNPPLPFKAFPSLMATSGTCVAEGPSMKKRSPSWECRSFPPLPTDRTY
jgi:Ferritin-like domain